VRLTLRTLLAYLDDTLEPAQARQIGQKVAESQVAQELIERIQRVIRQRKLTAPPLIGPAAKLDPNNVAEYLDSVLPNELLADVEDILLNSDIHLAEVAACHQILTLYLGQPDDAPSLALKRMYGLVKQEAEPIAAAAAKKPVPAKAKELLKEEINEEEEEYEEEEVPEEVYRRRQLAAGAVVVALVALLGVGIWQLWPKGPPAGPTDTQLAQNNEGPELLTVLPAEQPEKPPEKANVPPEKPPEQPPEKPPEQPPEKPPEKKAIDKPMIPKPSAERKVIGRQVIPNASQASVLLNRPPSKEPSGKEQWLRVLREGPVETTDTLMSLPGYRNEVLLESGLLLTLAGTAPEFYWDFPVLESSATLYVPSSEFDAELTLERGRIYLTNNKKQGELRVRVRFLEEIWDVTLKDPQSVVAVERCGSHPADVLFDKEGKGEGPMFFVNLYPMKGASELLINHYRGISLPAQTVFRWNSRQGAPEGPQKWLTPTTPLWFTKPDAANPGLKDQAPYTEMRAALKELTTRLNTKSVDIALGETRNEKKPASHILAIRCLAAVDEIKQLMDILGDETDALGRDVANLSLRHWIAQKPDNELILYRTLHEKMAYSPLQAEVVLELLHLFPPEARQRPFTYEKLIFNLTDKKLAIRYLSYWHLANLVPDGARAIRYDPAGDKELLANAQKEWKKLIPDGKLPPPPKTKPK
jgi:hypothetical protein